MVNEKDKHVGLSCSYISNILYFCTGIYNSRFVCDTVMPLSRSSLCIEANQYRSIIDT